MFFIWKCIEIIFLKLVLIILKIFIINKKIKKIKFLKTLWNKKTGLGVTYANNQIRSSRWQWQSAKTEGSWKCQRHIHKNKV